MAASWGSRRVVMVATILLAATCMGCASGKPEYHMPSATGFGALYGLTVDELSGQATWDGGGGPQR